jgi:hypothetical protein
MTSFVKNVIVEIDLKIYKDLLGLTEFNEGNLSEIIEKLLDGDFPVSETPYGECRSPVGVNLVSVKNIDSKWTEE